MTSFFVPLGDNRFEASVHTTGPWDARFQHAGPPSALLGRALEALEPDPDSMIGRVSVDILGPIPVGEVSLSARVLRPGRSVVLLEATMVAAGRDAARATAWRIKRNAIATVPSRHRAAPPLPQPQPATLPPGWVDGYLSAMEWRTASGSFGSPGPAVVWARQRVPLLPDEIPSPLQRVLAVADSGNGVSSELDVRHHTFMNTDLTVHLHREPSGEWICLDAQTAVSPDGIGLATSVLSDLSGPFGVGAQSLLVTGR